MSSYNKILLFGPTASGKTFTANTAFWDPARNEVWRPGLWISIGAETNPRIVLPDKYRRVIKSDPVNMLAFQKEIHKLLLGLHRAAAMGKHLGALVFDGITEFNLLCVHGWMAMHPEDKNKQRDAYKFAKEAAMSVIQLLDPDALGCDIIATARVTERKQGAYDPQLEAVVGADPEYVTDYYPGAEGWTRDNMGYYFPLVFYMELAGKGAARQPRLHLVSRGDYLVKNPWADIWGKLPTHLDKPTFRQVMDLFDKASAQLPTVSTDGGTSVPEQPVLEVLDGQSQQEVEVKET